MSDLKASSTVIFTRDTFLSRCVRVITPYALWKLHTELSAARGQDEVSPCSSSFSNVWGIPCRHKLVELLRQPYLDPSEFDTHWFIDREQAIPLRQPTRLLDFRTIARLRSTQVTHQAGAGVTGTRRVQSNFEDGFQTPTQMPTPAASTPSTGRPRGRPRGSTNRVRGGPGSRGGRTRGGTSSRGGRGRGRGRGAMEGVEYSAPQTLADVIREETARANDDDPQLHTRSFGYTEHTW